MRNLVLVKIIALLLFSSSLVFGQNVSLDPNFIQIPRLSVVPACGSTDKGKLYFNNNDSKMYFCNGSAWVDFSNGGFTLPYSGTGVQNSGGQAGMVKFINTAEGNGLYVKSGTGATLVAAQAYAAYFESSQNGIFAGAGAGKLALKTSGGLQLKGNGEGINKILTSTDAFGTAIWQSTAILTGLEVNGATTFGTNGTAIIEIIKETKTANIVSTPANTEATLTFTITNAQPGSTVYISPSQNLPDGLIIAHALCEAANTVEVKFFNASAVTVDPPSMNFHITVIR